MTKPQKLPCIHLYVLSQNHHQDGFWTNYKSWTWQSSFIKLLFLIFLKSSQDIGLENYTGSEPETDFNMIRNEIVFMKTITFIAVFMTHVYS